MAPTAPILSIFGVTKTYASALQALRGTDWEMHRRKISAVRACGRAYDDWPRFSETGYLRLGNRLGHSMLLRPACSAHTLALGGDMTRRVRTAKALAREPQLLLLHEPSAVDAELCGDIPEDARSPAAA